MINTTQLTNGTGNIMIDSVQTINTASGGAFGLMFLLAIYIISFVFSLRFGTKAAFLTSGFMGALLGLLLRALELINDTTFYFAIIILIIAAIASYMADRTE